VKFTPYTYNHLLAMTSTETTNSLELQGMNYLANFTNETSAQSYSNTTDIADLDLPEKDIAQISVLCIKSFIFGSIIIGAVLGNALVILAVRRNRKLR
jgi:hypothetical protein